MKIEKIIMSCDDSHYQYYWPVAAKTCKKVIKSTPVLFKITDNDSDFYFDGNGIVKNIKAIPNIDTGIQSLFYRIYGTKFFQDEVCLISDIDMLLLSEEYFQGTIKNFNEDSIVVYTSDAYDLNREDSKGLFNTNIFGMCYNAAKGKIFTDVLELNGSFEDFLKKINSFKNDKRLEWYGDEVYLTSQIEKFSDKYEIHKLTRGVKEGFVIENRIEKWNFPVDYVNDQMRIDNMRDGNYNKKLLEDGYYLDCHCIRPYGFYEKEINEVADVVCKKNQLIQTIDGWDYSTVNDRCLNDDGVVVDVGCLNWDWSNFFLGKKRIVGIDPFENQIPFTEMYKGVIGNYNGIIKMKNEGISSTMANQEDGEIVKVKTWKDFCDEYNIDKISILKINIEGAEYDLLDSLTDGDFSNIDQIAISFHDWMNPEWKQKTERSIKILESNNYEIQKINDDWGWYLAIKKNSRINNIVTDKENNLIYFKYQGPETHADVRICYKGLTAYKTEMKFSSDVNVKYYIGCYNFFGFVDEYSIEIDYLEISETEKITVNLFGDKKIKKHNFLTLKEDSSFHSFREIFIEKIYISDKVKVDKDDLVIDIGSNYGFFAFQSIEMGARKVICYEPSQRLQESLKFNLKNTNAITSQIGVSGKNSVVRFKDDLISSASSCISKDNEGYEIKIIGINDLIDSVGEIIDFLKIDCEGQEVDIFKNIESDRISKVKKLVVEYHENQTENLIKNRLISENFIIEKIENNIIYSYNPKLFIAPKKVALISTFCDTEEKLSILEENIIKIKQLGIDVIAISPIEIPQRVIKLCDYFFYTKDNELLRWPIRMYTHWYEMRLSDGKITTLQRGLADYGWAGLHQVKKLSQIGLTFDYDIFYHLIYDLEIDDVVETEFKSNNINIIHPRRDPHHPETLWETTLHFMVFDRNTMEKIEKEITLDEYLRTNGMAEGEVLKWKNKFNIPTSNHPVKDKIFYWGDYDFFDYSPFSDFKMFLSKNPQLTIWLGETPVYDTTLSENLRIVFHGFEKIEPVSVLVNGKEHVINPSPWEIIEFPISSQEIKDLVFIYNNQKVDFTKKYDDIMMNQIYYNHRP